MRLKQLSIVLVCSLAVNACDWVKNEQKLNCDVTQYASASISNTTSRDLQVDFCSTESVLPSNPQTVQAQTAPQTYRTKVGQRTEEVTAPFADSRGDGCAKMVGVHGENVESQIPFLSTADLVTTKSCTDGDQYVFVDIGQNCPQGYDAFDQSSVICK